MTKFTVKDFISYNSQCISCNSLTLFEVMSHPNNCAAYKLNTINSPNYLEINAHVKYNSSESLQLLIFHKTNQILSSNIDALIIYLRNYKLFFSKRCATCGTVTHSNDLIFHANINIIEPLSMFTETVILQTSDIQYILHSNFSNNETKLLVYHKKHDSLDASPLDLDLPLLPISSFKTRERLLEKLQLYVLFS
jgi:hypothetical protein